MRNSDLLMSSFNAISRSLCILHREHIVVHGPRGDTYSVTLPCKARAIWPLLEGLLVERDTQALQYPADSSSQTAPTLFSLLRPLEELKPLAPFASKQQSAPSSPAFDSKVDSSRLTEFVCDPEQRVVFTSNSQPFLLTYNESQHTHTLWVLRQSRSEVAKRMRSGLMVDGEAASSLPAVSEPSSSRLQQTPRTPAPVNRAQSMTMTLNSSPSASQSGVDDSINTELLLDCAWQQDGGSACCSSAFLAAGADAEPLLCMFLESQNQLVALKLSTSNAEFNPLILTPSFELKGRAAVPIHSGWHSSLDQNPDPFNYDILLLELDGSLGLYAGRHRICTVHHQPAAPVASALFPSFASPAREQSQSDVLNSPSSMLDEALDVSMELEARVSAMQGTQPLESKRDSQSQNVSLSRSDAHTQPTAMDLSSDDAPSPSMLDKSHTGSMASADDEFRPGTLDFFDAMTPNKQLKNVNTGRERDSMSDISVIVGLNHAVSNRVTVVTQDGKEHRGSVPTVHESALVKSCMQSLAAAAVPLQIVHCLRADLIQLRHEQPKLDEWSAFVQLIQRLADGGVDNSQSVRAPPATPAKSSAKPTAGSDADWDALLSSDLHRSFLHDSALRALSKSDTSSTATAPSASSAPAMPLTTDLHAFRSNLPAILRSLHLVYEDLKLNVLTQRHLRAMAAFLLPLAGKMGRSDFVDHYQRDFHDLQPLVAAQQMKTSSSSSSSQTTDQVPHILRWLLSCVRGTKSAYSSSQTYALFEKSDSFTAPCELSRKVCHFYDVLTRPDADRSRYSLAPAPTGPMSPPFRSPLRSSAAASSFATPLSPFVSPRQVLNSPPARTQRERKGTDPVTDEYPLFCPFNVAAQSRAWSAASPAERLVLAMVEEGFRLQDIKCLPFGVALPLREALRSCRHSPPGHWPAAAYELIGRQDLSRMLHVSNPAQQMSLSEPASNGGSSSNPDLAQRRGGFALEMEVGPEADFATSGLDPVELKAGAQPDDDDGTLAVERMASMRFGRDLRLKEVRKLLRSNRNVTLIHSQAKMFEIADRPDLMDQENQAKLQLLSLRTQALSVGRGMYVLASITPVLTEALPMPALCLDGKLPPKNNVVELDVSGLTDDDFTWPDFHNGCAAGLRVSPSQSQITRTWIVYNRPNELNYTHAGFLFALGLQGHLTALAPSDFFWYLSQNHDATTVAVLLGMASAMRGSMDTVCSHYLLL